jgi:hypothetical protein
VSTDRAAPRVGWDELVAMMPASIRESLPLVRWDIGKLHRLRLPVRLVTIEELAWQFDLPLWQFDGARFVVSPQQVRDDPAAYPDQMRRALASDLRYPIHLVEHNGRRVVLDGFHRLLKATIEGRTEIEAMTLTRRDLESILVA